MFKKGQTVYAKIKNSFDIGVEVACIRKHKMLVKETDSQDSYYYWVQIDDYCPKGIWYRDYFTGKR
jgi:hypothetical protein